MKNKTVRFLFNTVFLDALLLSYCCDKITISLVYI